MLECEEVIKDEIEELLSSLDNHSQVDEDNNSRKRFVYADTPDTQKGLCKCGHRKEEIGGIKNEN